MALNQVFTTLVTSIVDSWTCTIETQPLRVLTIAPEFADSTSMDALKELVQGMPPGDFLITPRGDLIPYKP